MIPILARGGYAARGIVFLIVGWFAIMAAIGAAHPKSSQDALTELMSQPLGGVLVAVMVFGLACFALWRLAQALLDTDNHGRSTRGLLIRGGLLGSAAAHALLAAFALGLLLDLGGSGDDARRELFGIVAGSPLLLCIVAAIVAGAGIAHFIEGWRLTFERHLPDRPRVRAVVRFIGHYGLMARGLVFVLIAGILVLGALRVRNASDPPTMQDALEFVSALPAGPLWLAAIGGGLLAFALYCGAEAAFRRIDLRLDDLT